MPFVDNVDDYKHIIGGHLVNFYLTYIKNVRIIRVKEECCIENVLVVSIPKKSFALTDFRVNRFLLNLCLKPEHLIFGAQKLKFPVF